MPNYRSPFAKAFGLAEGQRIIITHKDGILEVSGANESAQAIIRDSIGYDAVGRLRIRPQSQVGMTGASFILRQ